MKTPRLFLFLLFLFTINVFQLNAQSGWQPVLINYDGTNENEGIIGTYSISSCKNSDVVFFRLENTTSFKFKAQWFHLIQDKEGKDFKGNALLQTFIIDPNTTHTGSCKDKVLTIKLSDFGIAKENFGTFIALAFNIQQIN
jgi:hypothetical protein